MKFREVGELEEMVGRFVEMERSGQEGRTDPEEKERVYFKGVRDQRYVLVLVVVGGRGGLGMRQEMRLMWCIIGFTRRNRRRLRRMSRVVIVMVDETWSVVLMTTTKEA